MNNFLPIQFKEDVLILLDQRKLPGEELFVECKDLNDTHHAIKDMVVRGAPCIGFTAIFGMALLFKELSQMNNELIQEKANYLVSARPTAVNLKFEVEQVIALVKDITDTSEAFVKTVEYGYLQIQNSERNNRTMSQFVFDDLKSRKPKEKYNILTHCNTGFLACGSIGTALGVIQVMHEKNAIECVYADETRPYLQGSRLTAYELDKLGVNHRVVVEGAASFLMRNKMIDAIVVGADRIANNGDTANKVGTSNLSIIAKNYGVPFYVIAPQSSFDTASSNGDEIDIELRPESEILCYKEHRIAPVNSKAYNPSFDITDASFITGISNEKSIYHYPYNFKETI
jgi:methylthioribose-1-phosphate isomerase